MDIQDKNVTIPRPRCKINNIEKLIVAYEICLSKPIKYRLSFKLHLF
jgi:hypothetical protein